MKPGVKNEDVVGAEPTGDAPTTSEWSTILMLTKVRLILETWRYINGWAKDRSDTSALAMELLQLVDVWYITSAVSQFTQQWTAILEIQIWFNSLRRSDIQRQAIIWTNTACQLDPWEHI